MGGGTMTVEYEALAIGVLLIAVILLWKKARVFDARLLKLQNGLDELRTVESRLFLMALNANPKGDASTIGPMPAKSNGSGTANGDREQVPRPPTLVPDA
jgi:hypothetical protein